MNTKLKKKITDLAINVFDAESRAIDSLKSTIGEEFTKAIGLIINSQGKCVITGIGKSAIIAQKISATFNSTGQTSVYMHAVDALHGDLGILNKEDVLICLSKSGNSPEIVNLLPYIKEVGTPLIAITGNTESALAKASDSTLNVFVEREACINNLAPTSSTTTALVMGDALAVCLMEMRNFDENDFAKNHPSGNLGKIMLLKVSDLYTKNAIPSVIEDDSINRVILEITSKRLGATAVVNSTKELVGIITDGDLRRMLEKHENFSNLKARDIMGTRPKTINPEILGTKALKYMRENSITQLIVTENKIVLGFIHLHDLLKEGLT